jgi:hypothetical protein
MLLRDEKRIVVKRKIFKDCDREYVVVLGADDFHFPTAARLRPQFGRKKT